MKRHRLVRGIGMGEGKEQGPSATESKLQKCMWHILIQPVCTSLSLPVNFASDRVQRQLKVLWQPMASDLQKTFSVFHETIKYLHSLERSKRIPLESWNSGMSTFFTGFNNRRKQDSYLITRRLLSLIASDTPSMKCLGMSQLFKKILEKLRSSASAPPRPRAAFTPSLLVYELDLGTTSDVKDPLMLQLIYSPSLCLPVQSVTTVTWFLGCKCNTGLSLSLSLGRRPRSGL